MRQAEGSLLLDPMPSETHVLDSDPVSRRRGAVFCLNLLAPGVVYQFAAAAQAAPQKTAGSSVRCETTCSVQSVACASGLQSISDPCRSWR